jgi:hypothetical protein
VKRCGSPCLSIPASDLVSSALLFACWYQTLVRWESRGGGKRRGEWMFSQIMCGFVIT